MEFLRRQWAQVSTGLNGLSPEKKVIIALCVLLMVAILVLTWAWAGSSSLKTLPFVGDRADEVVASLRRQGIDAQLVDGEVKVSRSDEPAAVAVLWEKGLMTEDLSDAWSKLLGNQSPWETRDQAEERSRVAAMEYSRGVIRAMSGVKDARVFLAPRPNRNFGDTHVRRDASITVWMEGGKRIDQSMVEAIAAFVAAADAEMKPTDVSIIDGNNGTAHKVDDPDDVIPSVATELAQQREREYKDKITELLGITGARVAVTVQIDPVHKQQSQETDYEDNQPLASEETESVSRREVADAGEPGVRSNTGASIDGSSQAGTSETVEKSRSEFAVAKVTRQTSTIMSGHQVLKINVSIGVPRGFFVSLYKARNPDAEGEPDDAAIQPIVQEQLAKFKTLVTPLITTEAGPGDLALDVYEDGSALQLVGAAPTSSSIGAVMSGPWAQPAVAGSLVLGVLALMFYMVRRATRPESLPSIEELAGLPPRLPVDDDVVGEVDESEAMMPGFELDEKDLESRKMAEQISELIKGNPNEAGSLLGKWVKRDE